jgi:cobalt-zinc-cadmium efflux system membrane fusion protein
MKRAATLTLVLTLAAASCGRMNGDSGSGVPRAASKGIRDSRNAPVQTPQPDAAHEAMPGTNHAGMPNPESPSGRIPNPDSSAITLTPDMVQRAGIRMTAAMKGESSARLHLPGVVQVNAYKNVDVTSLVSGRVTQVRAALGQRVMENEVLANVYSPELADAQTTFIAARAELAAHDLALARTQRLFAIGAASRQELEKLDAEKADMDHAVETARARLVLLGIPQDKTNRIASPADVVTSFDVKAPIAGVITKRNANAGLNIDPASPIFTVTDLSTVWVVGDLYERDFAGVGVGSPVTITTASYPGLELRGRVEYIDPHVSEQTRTAQMRVEVPNAGQRLRIGMFMDMSIAARSPHPVVLVPKSAVQAVGDKSVVYVESGPGHFMAREVTVGDAAGDQVPISGAVNPGDMVVTEGGFFLRAEHERTP